MLSLLATLVTSTVLTTNDTLSYTDSYGANASNTDLALLVQGARLVKYDIVNAEYGHNFNSGDKINMESISLSFRGGNINMVGATLKCKQNLTMKTIQMSSPTNFSNTLIFHPEEFPVSSAYLLRRIRILERIDQVESHARDSKMKYYVWLVNTNIEECCHLQVKQSDRIDSSNYSYGTLNLEAIVREETHRMNENSRTTHRRRKILQDQDWGSEADGADDELAAEDEVKPLMTYKQKTHAAMKGVTTFFELMGKEKHSHHSFKSQKALDATNQRQLYLAMMEVSDKTMQMSKQGMQTKEVYSMVIDKIMNRLPEIMLQVLISILRKPFIHYAAQFMEANAPGMVAPNSQDTPEVPVVANIPGTSSMPPPAKAKCEKKGKPPPGETFAPGANPHALMFLDDCDDESKNKKGSYVSLVESKSSSNVNHYHNHRMHQGGEQGGPVARVMPLLRQTVMHGMAHHVIPQLQDEITVRVINRFDIVQNSVLRNSVRWLLPTLTASVSSKSIGATLGKTFRQTLDKTNKKVAYFITKQLTLALAEAITLSLTHQPRSDYYCHYCDAEKIYCEYCKSARKSQTEYAYYANYFGGYFGDYYAKQYGDQMAEYFVRMAKQVVSS